MKIGRSRFVHRVCTASWRSVSRKRRVVRIDQRQEDLRADVARARPLAVARGLGQSRGSRQIAVVGAARLGRAAIGARTAEGTAARRRHRRSRARAARRTPRSPAARCGRARRGSFVVPFVDRDAVGRRSKQVHRRHAMQREVVGLTAPSRPARAREQQHDLDRLPFIATAPARKPPMSMNRKRSGKAKYSCSSRMPDRPRSVTGSIASSSP